MKTVPLAGESCAGAGNVQFQLILAASTGPLKLNVSLQSLSGIAMLTPVVCPGDRVPLDGLNVTPAVAVDAAHGRLAVLC